MSCPRCNGPANDETLREFGGVCPKCLLNFSEEQDAPAFPNLEIVEMIGQGGMGVVYKARQKNLDRVVALKVLSPQLSDDPEFVERFTREAKALAQLNHPNIVAIHDSGIHDHVPYLVMEFVDGTPLRSMLASGKLTPDRALEVIPQICDALQFAHAHGIVHRDIKPENILIDRQGRVKIADFGLAKLSIEQSRITQSGYVLGTPRYMAPEQFEPSGRVDHRADIYSLGVVFYEMLTGEVPMGRFKPPSEKADVDRRLDPVVLKSLEREPEDRYQSAGEVKAQVAGLNASPAESAQVRYPGAPPPPHPMRKAAAIIAGLAGVALAAAVALSMLHNSTFSRVLTGAGISLLIASLVVWLLSLVIAPSPRRSGGAGCLVIVFMLLLVGLVLILLVSVGAPARPMPLPTRPGPPPVAVPAPPENGRFHHVTHPFKIDEVWPGGADLPAGLEGAKSVEGAELLMKADLPAEILNDLEYSRGIVFQSGRAIVVGLQFKNEFSRRRWQRDDVWSEKMKFWNYSLFGDSQGLLLLRHDRSAPGAAAAELLEAAVEKKLAAKYPPGKK
jgi:tRNA A-37 threonylcarbamoyl transferase component Bud32